MSTTPTSTSTSAPTPASDRVLAVDEAAAGSALAGFLRGALVRPWSEVRRLIATGKVFVDGRRAQDAGQRLSAGQRVELRMAAPRPRDGRPEVRIVHEDAQVVVIDKPPGVSTVPYEPREQGTAMDLLRDAWRRQGRAATTIALHVVHRIDKDTSGLVVFAKSKRAEIALAAQFRAHTAARQYLCLARGDVRFRRVESFLVRDRGDGLRGSSPAGRGKRAVTHVEVVTRFAVATLCRVRLETGRTHQIRIHFAERGHPIAGETVYIRDLAAAGIAPLAAGRLMLHAELLGFAHPTTGAQLSFDSSSPDFAPDAIERVVQAARRTA
ncbi:MAG TPA: RluA family pseudouridine synthase [Kofleriaceae bacterium]|nr:RluA family pseudouridine synthase [Kofleriaceae bacterium]